MRERRAASTAVAVAVAITAAAGAVTAVVVAASASPGPSANELAILLAVVTYAGVGLLVEHAHPGHRVGRLMLAGAVAWGVGEGLLALGLQGSVHAPGSVPAAELLGVLGTTLRGAGWWVLILAVPLVFPDGQPPWPGRRAPQALLLVAITTFTAATLLAPQPLDFRLEAMDSPTGLPDELAPVADLVALFGLGLCIAALAVAVAGLAHRWRSGGELRRQQLLWLCVAFAAPVLFLPLIATRIVDPWMFAVVVIPVPVSIAVAILQRRLYDVQLAVTRTLTWLGLSSVVALLYALTVGGVGALLSQSGAHWLPWAGAGVVAVSFAPLHRLFQQMVNSLVYGQWTQPAQVLAATGRRLADASDVPALLQTLVTELHRGLALERVEIRDKSGRLLADQGDHGLATAEQLTLTAYGLPVGALRWRGPRLRPAERRLLEDIALQVGGVVHAAGLLESVRAAQHRLVLAREEERRRLRRDLHDGLGPQLAALTMQVDTLRNRLGLPEVDTDAELIVMRGHIQATVSDVRRVVEGLRPPALDELGLTGAIKQLARRMTSPSLEVGVEIEPLPALPAAVEVASYRIVLEALTNVVKHSGATRARIRMRAHSGAVVLEVSDDGSGAAAARDGGLGLISMRERAEQISGRLSIDTRPGRGTCIRTSLPLDEVGPIDAKEVRS
jgi:signal transduction histidine kinase